ncbi:hypothetical protein CDV55_105797 [Aspergillus turcosus]|nr:hypothetical protein CDV55_105797 [Aspergillus turcosus]
MSEIHPGMAADQNGFTCPLCKINVQPPASFEKHVGRHLEELALFVLPRTDPSEEANSESGHTAWYDINQSIGSDGIGSDVGPESTHRLASGDDAQDIQSLEVDELSFAGDGEEQYSDTGSEDDATAYSYTNAREQFKQDSVARLNYGNRVSGESPAERLPRLSRRLSGSDMSPKNKDMSFHELIPGNASKEIESSDEKHGIDARPSTDADTPPKGISGHEFLEELKPVDVLKEGIPPGARWTKIDRRLVNPAALEAGGERFEESPDHVIVLRVLSKEEVRAYASKTYEIRNARHQEYLEERRRHGD